MVLRPGGDYGGNYADCFPQTVGGGHHFYESIKSELDSFRLRDDFPAAADHALNDDTSSIASKKRIDSLFRTTTAASVAGDDKKRTSSGGGGAGRRAKSLQAKGDDQYRGNAGDYFHYDYPAPRTAENKNTVQEKIEKMFAEISSSELDTDVSMDSAAAIGGGSNKYHVQYIGCAGLSGKISSLEGLQQPVREMYFEYRENQHHYYGGDNGGSRNDVLGGTRRDFSGLLEISAAGLTIRYRDDGGDMLHRTKPFPSIAVWAALKYVCRRRSPPAQRKTDAADSSSASGTGGYEYAFLPLIADPDGVDKAPLFQDMDAGDRARLDAAGDHAPVFAVVTRKAGKRLECHGFACETENDALLMAANLYSALVATMSSACTVAVPQPTASGAGDEQAVVPSTRRVIRQRNGFTACMSSTAGSSVAGAGDVAPTVPPPRPPRRNKKHSSSSTTSSMDDGDRMSVILGNAGDTCSDAKTFRMTVRQPASLRRGVCNSSSSSHMVAEQQTPCFRKDEPWTKSRPGSSGSGGDIFTKVAIPRSRSFLSSNGLASAKYSRRAPDCGIETADAERQRRRSNGSSVMGFSDMFNELRVQEGLHNMDDIMNAIVNVEGMSYNDLKPIYREFLMKLAMTLTKDELYQRTKAIMTEQKRKRNKRRPMAGSAATSATAAGRGRRLNNKLWDAFNLRAAKDRISSVLPDFCKRKKRKKSRKQPRRRRCSCCTSGTSSEFQPAVDRKNLQPRARAAHGKRASAPMLKNRRRGASSPVLSTSDDSEFFAAAALRQRQHRELQQQQQQLLLQQQKTQPYRKSKTRGSKSGGSRGGTTTASEGGCRHRASSGYYSCSECSAGAADDKCYCVVGPGSRVADAAERASLVSCSCDSDSCADSEKCYCGRPRRARNIFDELKSRGFAASESSLSRADTPGTAWKKNELLLAAQQRHEGGGSSSAATGGGGGGGGIEPSKSLEYLQVTRRPLSVVGPHYTSVIKPVANDSTTVPGSSTSSPLSSLSAATACSSSSAIAAGRSHYRRRQRRSGSSGSDNFRAIDYALFANNGGAAGRASRDFRRQHPHYRAADCGPAVNGGGKRPSATAVNHQRRSYSAEAVHLTGCQVYHHQRQQPQQQANKTAVRRHSVQYGGVGDVSSSFFKSGIENSLGYYP